jgi:hypothetical protein
MRQIVFAGLFLLLLTLMLSKHPTRSRSETGGSTWKISVTPTKPPSGIRFSVPTQSGRDLVSTSGRDGQVPGVSDVKLSVFDLLGREVAVLVSERPIATDGSQCPDSRGGFAAGCGKLLAQCAKR